MTTLVTYGHIGLKLALGFSVQRFCKSTFNLICTLIHIGIFNSSGWFSFAKEHPFYPITPGVVAVAEKSHIPIITHMHCMPLPPPQLESIAVNVTNCGCHYFAAPPKKVRMWYEVCSYFSITSLFEKENQRQSEFIPCIHKDL